MCRSGASRHVTAQEFFARVWEMLIGRVDGPFTFRLLIQPTVAAIFAIRPGWRDARENRPPYLWSILTEPATRHDLLRQGLADVGKVFIVAVVLDLTYEAIVYRWVYPGQALIVAAVLAFIPYLLIRGPANRIARRSIRR
jgi:hypothetical protein